MHCIRHGCIKTTRLLLGVEKYNETRAQRINSICHEYHNTTRLLLGFAKYKESHAGKKKYHTSWVPEYHTPTLGRCQIQRLEHKHKSMT